MEKKRILLVVRRLKMGGIERATLNLSAGLIQAGHEVHVVVLKGNNSLLPIPDGLHVHFIDLEKKARNTLSGFILNFLMRTIFKVFLPRFSFFWMGTSIAREMSNSVAQLEREYGCIDLILLRGQGVFESLWRFKHKSLWLLVETFPLCFRGCFSKTLYSFLYKNKNIAAVAKFLGDVLFEHLQNENIPFKKTAVIYNAMPIKQIKALAQEKIDDLPEGDYLIHVARLSPVKNQKFLIEAYYKANIKESLIIVGDGEERKSLENFVRKLKLEDRVKFYGLKPNPFPYIYHAKAFLICSIREGLPLSVIESLACSTQVVATDIPSGLREILIDEQEALICKQDIDSFAKAINHAIVSPIHVKPAWADRFDLSEIIPKVLELSDR